MGEPSHTLGRTYRTCPPRHLCSPAPAGPARSLGSRPHLPGTVGKGKEAE